MNLAVCKADGEVLWLSWPRNYRLAGCTRLAVASCRRWAKPLRQARRAIEARRSASARETSSPMANVRHGTGRPRLAEPAGTTLLSATW